MVQINLARREINCKIVYYGPGMGGKTTNLEKVHEKLPDTNRGKLTSIATEQERTLFFDFMPLDLGEVAGMQAKFQLYTVPGQAYYKSTRKLVLRGVDGVVFVADSGPDRMKDNVESLEDLAQNLQEQGKKLEEIPLVMQYNKRDLPGALAIEDLERELNRGKWPTFPAVAVKGEGVMPSLKAISRQILEQINQRAGTAVTADPDPEKQETPVPVTTAVTAAPPPPAPVKIPPAPGVSITPVNVAPPARLAPRPAASPATTGPPIPVRPPLRPTSPYPSLAGSAPPPVSPPAPPLRAAPPAPIRSPVKRDEIRRRSHCENPEPRIPKPCLGSGSLSAPPRPSFRMATRKEPVPEIKKKKSRWPQAVAVLLVLTAAAVLIYFMIRS